MRSSHTIRTVLVAGLTAAAMDMLGAILVYAFLLRVTTAERVMQSVASGAFGKAAFAGGWPMAFAGLGFHIFIAVCFAAFYRLLYPYWTRFFNNPVIAGFCYGCIVWSIMNLVVLPVTGKPASFDLQKMLISLGIIIVCVGLPIAIITDKRIRRVE